MKVKLSTTIVAPSVIFAVGGQHAVVSADPHVAEFDLADGVYYASMTAEGVKRTGVVHFTVPLPHDEDKAPVPQGDAFLLVEKV